MVQVCPEERSPRVQASFLTADEVGGGLGTASLKTTRHLTVGSPLPTLLFIQSIDHKKLLSPHGILPAFQPVAIASHFQTLHSPGTSLRSVPHKRIHQESANVT